MRKVTTVGMNNTTTMMNPTEINIRPPYKVTCLTVLIKKKLQTGQNNRWKISLNDTKKSDLHKTTINCQYIFMQYNSEMSQNLIKRV